jgi:hypothetical protein
MSQTVRKQLGMSVEQIQTLVDALALRLGRAVVLDDQNLRLVAVSEDFGDADPARVWSLLHRRTRPEDVRYTEIKQFPGPGYIPENPELDLWRRLCVPVRCRGLLLGFVWITDRYGDLTGEQVADASQAAQAMGVLLHRRLVATDQERDVRQQLVERLLSHDPALGRGAREEVLDRGFIDDDSQVAVLLVSCRGRDGDGVPPDTGAAFAIAVERFCRGLSSASALTALWPRRATVILAQHQAFGNGQLKQAAAGLLTELGGPPGGRASCWRIGVGGPVPGLLGLHRAKQQADIALSVADEGRVAVWSELSADVLLAQLAPAAWEDVLLPEGVAALLADPSAAVLLPSLERYLDCAGDVQRAARELCVHRTTLYYRLGRAEQISGLSLRNGRDRLLLHLVLGLRNRYGIPDMPGLPTDVEVLPLNARRRAG